METAFLPPPVPIEPIEVFDVRIHVKALAWLSLSRDPGDESLLAVCLASDPFVHVYDIGRPGRSRQGPSLVLEHSSGRIHRAGNSAVCVSACRAGEPQQIVVGSENGAIRAWELRQPRRELWETSADPESSSGSCGAVVALFELNMIPGETLGLPAAGADCLVLVSITRSGVMCVWDTRSDRFQQNVPSFGASGRQQPALLLRREIFSGVGLGGEMASSAEYRGGVAAIVRLESGKVLSVDIRSGLVSAVYSCDGRLNSQQTAFLGDEDALYTLPAGAAVLPVLARSVYPVGLLLFTR